ncbi:MAG: pyridoxal phosphate-dependent aminotransferase [Acidimicrobiia bacterium]|nr:pyridoxal phosphate-dependent aminotransferase [Acidimicrobiia bacterium]
MSARVQAISESATLAVTAKAKALRAKGVDVIGFGAGEPDFPTPPRVVEAARAAALDPASHRYTPAAGLPALREAIAAKTQRDSGYSVEPSQVIVTNGGKHAVYATMQTLVDPGDEVLLPSPYWVTYPEAVALAGGTSVIVPTDSSSGYRVSVAQLEAARTDKTKLLIFVSPSNPTGGVYTPDEVRAIGEWAAANDIWVMCDEIYEHLVYGDSVFSSMPVEAPEAKCVVVNGVAKTYAMTGWRVGWMIAPKEVAAAATRLQSHMTSNVNNIAQRATIEAVSGPLDAVAEMRSAFDRRRRTMHRMLNDISGVECPEPQGAFYAFPNFEAVLGREFAGRQVSTTLELADVLLDEVGVAIVPGEAFGAPGCARLSFALGDDDLAAGIERMATLLG